MEPLFRPVDIRSLAAFRIAFGTMMVAAVARYFAYGWIDELYRTPQMFFHYPGLEWLKPLPGAGMYVFYGVLGGLAACLAVGLFYRVSAALFCLGFSYAHLIDKANYLNHYYLISLVALLLALLPAGRAWSVDVWRRPSLRLATVPAWTIWLLRFQLGVVYFFAGIAKLTPDWLLRAQPLRLWLAPFADLPWIGGVLTSDGSAFAMSWAGAGFDLAIAFLLVYRRTRGFAYAAVVVFHAVTALFFPIGLFPLVMIVMTPIFFEPDWPSRLVRRSRAEVIRHDAQVGWRGPSRPWVLSGLAVYALVQVALPLRFLWGEGDLFWRENDFRFSWRVMLIEKQGLARFQLVDKTTGEARWVEPRAYLTPLQSHMMATQPDMILQFAHWLAERERQSGREVEVRADVHASLNGRRHQPLVDPTVDLAAIDPSEPRERWTRPLPEL